MKKLIFLALILTVTSSIWGQYADKTKNDTIIAKWLFENELELQTINGSQLIFEPWDTWISSYSNDIYVRDIHRSFKYGGSRSYATTTPANSYIFSHEWGTSVARFNLGTMTVRMRGEAALKKFQWAIRTGSYNGQEIISVNNEGSGRVGINQSNPTEALDVNGTILATEIKVAANGNTADFVFSDTYNLKDLTEVENYIKTHKHLPDIPSAEEMEASGVNLAEMNKLLLQKVEELTLYVIKKDKQNKILDEKLKQQDKRLDQLEILLQSYLQK